MPLPFEIADMLLELLVLHYYVLFRREAAYFRREIGGVNKVDDEYAVEKAYAKRESKIVRKPAQGVHYMGVYAEIVDRSQHSPEKGK